VIQSLAERAAQSQLLRLCLTLAEARHHVAGLVKGFRHSSVKSRRSSESVEFLGKQAQNFVGGHAVEIPSQVKLVQQARQPPRAALYLGTVAPFECSGRGIEIEPRGGFGHRTVRHQLFSRCKLLHDVARLPKQLLEKRQRSLRLVAMCAHNKERTEQEVAIEPLGFLAVFSG